MNWNEMFAIFDLKPGIGEICLRLLCAMIVGLVIGTEREYTHRPAGMRTHILVALGACVVAITGELIFNQYQAIGAAPDPARLSAQVISGVGFLGAGTILREGPTVKGLTTAASLWAVACLGIAAGSGYYVVALAGMLFILVTLTVFEIIQRKLVGTHTTRQEFMLETADISQGLALIDAQAQSERAVISHIQTERRGDGCRITFSADFIGDQSLKRSRRFFERLAADPCVTAARQSENAAYSKA